MILQLVGCDACNIFRSNFEFNWVKFFKRGSADTANDMRKEMASHCFPNALDGRYLRLREAIKKKSRVGERSSAENDLRVRSDGDVKSAV